MYTLRRGSSKRRDVSNSNHDGLMRDPLHSVFSNDGLYRFRHSHLSEDPTMVSCQWRVVEAPPLQVIEVPCRDRQMSGDFHPMSLCLEIAMHWRRLEALTT